jgi:hypothetical protein
MGGGVTVKQLTSLTTISTSEHPVAPRVRPVMSMPVHAPSMGIDLGCGTSHVWTNATAVITKGLKAFGAYGALRPEERMT